jgi:hypothetical protein
MVHPVGIYARMHANRSAIDKLVKITTRAMAATSTMDVTPCVNRISSWKLLDLLGLYVKT